MTTDAIVEALVSKGQLLKPYFFSEDELREAIRLARPEWVSVRTALPQPQRIDGDEVAPYVPVLFYSSSEKKVCAGRYFPNTGEWVSLQRRIFLPHEVTHWMPLPPPPNPTS